MYVPDHFREDRPDVLADAVRQIGFATLVTAGLEANHLPMLLQDGVLRGHVARANPVWKQGDGEALAIFLGPHAYVSPNWYPSKAQTGKAVPTWNYITVHARGNIRWMQDADWLRAHVASLSDEHEAQRQEPWKIGDAPDSYIATMLRGIMGFELTIETWEGKYKLSQNRDAVDRDGVREAFAQLGRSDLSGLME
ncbi:MAG: FMN-binding negative transcriptional regulator [Alphaproteobacteria bacterium]|nr:FMN-binding negative transcriptional regulator [Alphaproteobacteria bacterium]